MLERGPKTCRIPRILTAALRGGAGKTLITVGLICSLRRRGFSVCAFKKGPDYIDAGWLGLAAGNACYNLDGYLFDAETARESFAYRSSGRDVAVIEGNRGLFDGVDSVGGSSTAELAKLLRAPVLLIIDATKMTRTSAALVLGCRAMDPDLSLKGVILNRVGGPRHERVLRDSIEKTCSIPVVGAVSKLALANFPQRHLGLLPLQEHPAAAQFVEDAGAIVERSVDLDAIISISSTAGELTPGHWNAPSFVDEQNSAQVKLRIGVIRDSAFQFYYPENLESLTANGADLVEVSALKTAELPDLDCLYIGGGFPETHSERLADNIVFKRSLLRAIECGLPVYAECGGLMYLSNSIHIDGSVFPMVGHFPADTVLKKRPQGLGYVRVEVARPNPFFPVGSILSGHEFHYSSLEGLDASKAPCAFRVLKGHGVDGSWDGVSMGNALGTYMHLHALGEPLWAQGILNMALQYKNRPAAWCRAADRAPSTMWESSSRCRREKMCLES